MLVTAPESVVARVRPSRCIISRLRIIPADIMAPPSMISHITSLLRPMVVTSPSGKSAGARSSVMIHTRIKENRYSRNVSPRMGYSFLCLITCIQLPHMAAASNVSTMETGVEKYIVKILTSASSHRARRPFDGQAPSSPVYKADTVPAAPR